MLLNLDGCWFLDMDSKMSNRVSSVDLRKLNLEQSELSSSRRRKSAQCAAKSAIIWFDNL